MRLAVYLASSPGFDPQWAAATADFGRRLAARGIDVVYGGGSRGLMGVLADAALAGGARVTGVITEGLAAREHLHPGLHETHIVTTIRERCAIMAELADGFVALPGGIGTLEELFEQWSAARLGLHAKPIGLYNLHEFWTPLMSFISGVATAGFMTNTDEASIMIDENPDRLISWLSNQRIFDKKLSI